MAKKTNTRRRKRILESNLCRSIRKIAMELEISRRSFHGIIGERLEMSDYKLQKKYNLNDSLKVASEIRT